MKMKKFLFTVSFAALALFIFSTEAAAQKDKSTRPSPPAQVSEKIGSSTVTIDYSQPSKKDRDIFGGLVPYGKVWRTGANEATWIEVSADVKVQEQTLKAGKYGVFTIPGENDWTIIFNSKWDQWGSSGYDESADVLRVKAKTSSTSATEKFTIALAKNGMVTISWDQTKAEFTIK
jgi:hypothetical protein